MWRPWCLFLVASLGPGCDSLPPAPPLFASERSRAVGSSESVSPADLAPPSLVAVELSGRVGAAGAPAGRALVFVTDGPCFRVGTHYQGAARPGPDGSWSVQLFPPAGTRLEVCAAVVEEGRRTTSWWARSPAGPWIAQGRSGMKVGGADVSVVHAEEIALPAGIKLAP